MERDQRRRRVTALGDTDNAVPARRQALVGGQPVRQLAGQECLPLLAAVLLPVGVHAVGATCWRHHRNPFAGKGVEPVARSHPVADILVPALNPSNRYAACGPPARKATGMSRPIDADGTIRLSKPAAFAVPVEPENTSAARHPAASAIAESRRKLIDKLFILCLTCPIAHTGSNCEMSHRPSTFSRLTRTLDVL